MKYLLKNSPEEKELLERFVKYAETYSTSSEKNADRGITPSTECQKDFAVKLAGELKKLGFQDVQITDYAYVYGFVPASEGCEKSAAFCLLAHMDTVEEVSGLNVKPNIIKDYDGKVIELKNNVVLDPSKNSQLAYSAQNRETIITSDGTTLLGGDDKAGIAAIVTALNYLLKHPEIPHGKIEVIFSPDEETGHGMDKVPLELLESKYAYTVDGGHIGELEYECFNAYKSEITFKGRTSHTDNARANKMVNAITMASAFTVNLPRHEAPETTDGYLGFYAPMDICGNMEEAKVSLYLRDFFADNMEERKRTVETIAAATAAAFGGNAEVKHIRQYLNMREAIEKNPLVKEQLVKAYGEAGVDVEFKPIRGGTDGSRLSEMGIPTPNIFTGAHNYHSPAEWVSLDQMRKASDVIVNLCVIAGNNR